MNAQALAQETVEYAIKHMIAKLQAAGYSEQQAAVYLTSEEGIKTVLRLGEQFMRSLVK